MNKIFILLTMIFSHIVDDYYLQGWLASAKQKKWWRENAPQRMYRNDYLMALFMHSFSWAFMIMLPIVLLWHVGSWEAYILFFVKNLILHFIIDNDKANLEVINLVQDQSIRMIQIIATWIAFVA